jgi:hypothetical protein
VRACHPRVTEWTRILHTRLPPLSKPHATVLALWSLGMGLARAGALPAVSVFLATWLDRTEPAVRQQWRAFGYEATAQRGTTRGALAVEPCFTPWWAGGVAPWEGPQLALALDATTWGDRFTGLARSGVSRGCALPGAWTVLAAPATQAWRRAWWRMLRRVPRAGPRAWTVLGLADRGLDARGLCRRRTRLGWQPFLRVHTGGTFRPPGPVRGVSLKTLVPEPGTTWQGTGIAFKGRHRQLPCTLLACWEPGDKAPWLLLTDWPPAARTACWYGLRAWIAQGFKLTKRAGWPWQRPRLTQPDRATRLWLAVAVVPLWRLSVGGEADATRPASPVLDVTALVPQQPQPRGATRLRLVRVFRRGWTLLLVAWRDHAPLPVGRFVPEPWPTVPVPEEEPPAVLGLAVPQAA